MRNGPYILIIPPNDYPGKRYRGKYSYEHRVNWWKKTGLNPDNFSNTDIHHRNENKHDNNYSNLDALDHKEHVDVHAANRIVSYKHTCKTCGTEFENKRKGTKFCSRKCIGLFGFTKKDQTPIWNQIKNYVEEGYSDYKIAELTGMHRSTVQRMRIKNEQRC